MNYASYIDHTNLKPEATAKDIDKLIAEAINYKFKTVCLHSSWIKYAKDKLNNATPGITTVVGFPLGASISAVKAFETKLAIEHGADEIDMVINIGRFKDGQDDYIRNEIKQVKANCGSKILKVIIETALLTKTEIERISAIVMNSGADFIKTSTGFSYRGASFEDIEIIKKVVGDKIAIKASGGIKTLADMQKMLDLGAIRIGTSAGVAIINSIVAKNGTR